jgi:uncharacterized protein YmfQ (DUF2313 family)
MTADQYQAQLVSLLPSGSAWPRDPTSLLGQVLLAQGAGLATLDARTDDLVDEADPRTCSELLADWERVAGLPDTCAASAGSIQERHAALVTRLTNAGGQSPAYFIALAASLGYTVTITEFRPDDCEQACEAPIIDELWANAWQINSALNTIRVETCADDCEMPLQVWGNALLECAIGKVKPAHTTVLFAYQ